MKQCSKCQQVKSRSEFYGKKSATDGLNSWCKTCFKKQVSKRYFENPEPAKQVSRQWRIDNPEKTKQNNKSWRINNAEYKAAKDLDWRKNNREKYLENSRTWASNNRLRRRENELRRRARKYNNGVYKVTIKELRKLRDQNCLYCGQQAKITIDHILPIARGGAHSIGNLAPACQPCNSSKGAKTITEWKMAKRKATN